MGVLDSGRVGGGKGFAFVAQPFEPRGGGVCGFGGAAGLGSAVVDERGECSVVDVCGGCARRSVRAVFARREGGVVGGEPVEPGGHGRGESACRGDDEQPFERDHACRVASWRVRRQAGAAASWHGAVVLWAGVHGPVAVMPPVSETSGG